MAAGAVSLRKSHDIVILSFCNIVKGQANYHWKKPKQKVLKPRQKNFPTKENSKPKIKEL